MWCLYANIRKRKEWLRPNKKATPRTKTCVHPQKNTLCIWWNSEGVLYYELLSWDVGLTITADIYCQQLSRLADAIQEKRPTRLREVMLLYGKARPHFLTWQKTVYRIWVGKSLRTHLDHLILHPRIFTFSSLYLSTFKEKLFRMKMCPEHGLAISTQKHAISTGEESKNYSIVGRLL